MVASSELFGKVASLDAAYQTVVKHPKSIMMDGSTEADETGTAGQSWGLFVESMILKEDRRDRSMLVQRIPSPKIENMNRNSSERIPRKKTLNLVSGPLKGRSVARPYFSLGTGLVSIDTARSRPNQRPPRVVHSKLGQ